MGIAFPAIEPTAFAFSMPKHPVTSAMSESGVEDHRLWGTVAIRAIIELEFSNILFTQARAILATFSDSYSGLLPLDLPDILFSGITAEDQEWLESITTERGLIWSWPLGEDAPAPRASLTYRRRCTLPVRLVARLENTTPPVPPPPIAWISRLLTATRSPSGNDGPLGSVSTNSNGDNFQVFWFEAVGGSAVRVAVCKRSKSGDPLWSCWTSGEFGSNLTSRDAVSPQVLPLGDGGCVVFACAQTTVSTYPDTFTLRAWRINSDGSQEWSRQYVGPFTSPYRVALNGNFAICYCGNTFLGAGSITRIRPALLVIDISSGSYVIGSGYRINENYSDTYAHRSDTLLIEAITGSIILKAAQNVLIKLNAYGNSVAQAARLTGLDGKMAALPSGDLVCRNNSETLVVISPAFTVSASFRQIDAMIANGTFYGYIESEIGVATDGAIYHMGNTYGGGQFFSSGVKIAKLNSAMAPVGYGEIGLGSGIGSQYEGANWGVNSIDTLNRRGLVHIMGSYQQSASCRVHLLSFNLELPTATTNTTPARTLDTQGCGNTLSLRGWTDVSFTAGTPASITRTVPSVAVISVTATESTGQLNMVDASASLFWQKVSLTS